MDSIVEGSAARMPTFISTICPSRRFIGCVRHKPAHHDR